jgi:RNA polymerase sigma-70 factor, ECF subfamily
MGENARPRDFRGRYMTQYNEQQVVRSILHGDRTALSVLLERYQRRMYNLVLRMVGNRDDAAELTQDAMLKIVEHIHEFRGHSGIWTWMARIAMNLSISHLRKRRVRSGASLESLGANGRQSDGPAMDPREQIPDHREPRPDSGVQRQEAMAQIKLALARLDDDSRAVIVLRDIGDFEYKQIAEILSLELGTVKSRLFRARSAVRAEMRKFEELTPDAAASRE